MLLELFLGPPVDRRSSLSTQLSVMEDLARLRDDSRGKQTVPLLILTPSTSTTEDVAAVEKILCTVGITGG